MDVVNTFKNLTLTRFIEELESQGFYWIVKRLAGNDTGLTKSHQVGIYYPKEFFEFVFPEICRIDIENPDSFINNCYFVNEDFNIEGIRAIYYNNKYTSAKGTRNEYRLTRWGGSSSPVQNPENTGSICIFAVKKAATEVNAVCWVAQSENEEDLIEEWLTQEVEPGLFYMSEKQPVKDSGFTLPEEWFIDFPTGKEIFNFVTELHPRNKWKKSLDNLLLKRREVEFEIFEIIEQKHVWPTIEEGFGSVNEFIKYANSVSNRRKSRTGTSLELNLESIFNDEKLLFETQVITENKKKPDFLFPSGEAYHNQDFITSKLNMLAAKTCCKDRWRQVINEANRIETKHLFTLQQGVSSNQLLEMKSHNIELVVPKPHVNAFPEEWRESLMTLESFVGYIKTKQA